VYSILLVGLSGKGFRNCLFDPSSGGSNNITPAGQLTDNFMDPTRAGPAPFRLGFECTGLTNKQQ